MTGFDSTGQHRQRGPGFMKFHHIILLLILATTIPAFTGCSGNNRFTDRDRTGGSFAVYRADELENGTFLHDFLLLGPFPNPLPEGVTEYFHTDEACIGFATDYLLTAGGESGVKPLEGNSVELATGENFTWQAYQSPDDRVDLKKIFTPNEGVVCYAAIWIESSRKQEKLLGLGSNDGIKVWFNGEPVLKVHKPRPVRVDDEYVRLKLKKGRNLLLMKIEQGYGGWGFVLRAVDDATAWEHVCRNPDVAMNSEFRIEKGFIVGTVGDQHVVGMLRGLPEANIEFRSIHSDHIYRLAAPVGSGLKLPLKDFPGKEYAITFTFETTWGTRVTHAYMCTGGDIIEQTRSLIRRPLPDMPASVMADYYRNFQETVRWLDQTNKLWQHPYGYRRYLDGLKQIHTGAEKLVKREDPFQAVFPSPRERTVRNGRCTVTGEWRIHDPGKTDDFISTEIERVWRSGFHAAPAYTDDPGKPRTISLMKADPDQFSATAGSYIMEIDPDRITITSASRQGLFYGINTLLQALEQQHELPVGSIADRPEYPLRSTLQSTTELTPAFREYIEQLARLRYNVVYISSDNYLELDNIQAYRNTSAIFDFCKSRFIEPVPYFETFGAGTITRITDPCLDEGIFHEKEPWHVPGNGIMEPDVPRILDCPGTTLHIFTQDGEELVRDRDYEIIATEKPVIKILNRKYVETELLLSFDAVDFTLFPYPASCPSDPHGWEIQEKVISDVITKLHPRSLHISQDEAGAINRCSRCLARKMSNKEMMIDQINRVYRLIRKYGPDVEVCIWGDLFNDYQNAPMLGVEGAVEGLPPDILVHDWNYVAVYHSDRAQTRKQLRFYLERGYRTGGVVWFEPANILDIMEEGKKYGSRFTGMMHTAWAGFDHSLYPVAEANWTGKSLLGALDF